MSPSAEPAIPATLEACVPIERLEDGEVIILAVKPSRWFVLLVSWPWIAVVAVAAVSAFLADRFGGAAINLRMVGLICSAVACVRVTVACFQWHAHLYVLTSRRVMRFRGLLREDFHQCPLNALAEVHMTATVPERLVASGSLWFRRRDDRPGPAGCWVHLAQPRDVQRAVEEALRRAR